MSIVHASNPTSLRATSPDGTRTRGLSACSHGQLRLLLAAAALFTATTPASSASASPPTVRVSGGLVRGAAPAPGSTQFLGVPFASPPTGDLRWRPPQPAAAWAPKVLDATTYGPSCSQIPANHSSYRPIPAEELQDEDCLYLNVFAPERLPGDPATYPVMVGSTSSMLNTLSTRCFVKNAFAGGSGCL